MQNDASPSSSEFDEILQTDVLVIGAGVSGYCAAIQAARTGCEVILLEKDFVLGGNAGPNVGVHIAGADRYHHFSTETGIIAELSEEQAWCCAQTQVSPGTLNCNISRRFEAIVQTALQQAGVRVLKQHYARRPIVDGQRIAAVIAEDLAAFRTKRIDVRHVVVEASGDGEIGAQAGAGYRFGREAQSEYGERSAPEVADQLVQGTSLMAIAQNTHRPVHFVPPPNLPPYEPRLWFHAPGDGWHERTFRADRDLLFLYVTETGGNRDTIRDDRAIYEDLLGQLWAEWDHIKNGPHAKEAATWDLLWISPKAGKRESRRLQGDYTLTQTDIEAPRRFPNAVAYGGFDIDIHEPVGNTADIVSYSLPPLYSIPLGCLYSCDVENLLLAGRLISATHMAHGSTRVMRTGAVIGQAVGMAAALCVERQCTPRQLAGHHVATLQQRLLKADATILGVPNRDDTDLARNARVEASSQQTFNDQTPEQWMPLDRYRGLIVYDWPTHPHRIELYLRNKTDVPQPIVLTVSKTRFERSWKTHEEFTRWRWRDLRTERFEQVLSMSDEVAAQSEGWLAFDVPNGFSLHSKDVTNEEDRLLFSLAPCNGVSWAVAARPCEIAQSVERQSADCHWHVMSREADEKTTVDYPDPHAPPKCLPPGPQLMLKLDPAPLLGEATSVINGFSRRFSTAPTNMWISRLGEPLPQDLTLRFDLPVALNTVQLVFDTLYDDYHDMPHNYGPRAAGMCVKDYRLEAQTGNRWQTIASVADNYHRLRVHRFEQITAEQIRLVVGNVWEYERYGARVYEIRVYNK